MWGSAPDRAASMAANVPSGWPFMKDEIGPKLLKIVLRRAVVVGESAEILVRSSFEANIADAQIGHATVRRGLFKPLRAIDLMARPAAQAYIIHPRPECSRLPVAGCSDDS